MSEKWKWKGRLTKKHPQTKAFIHAVNNKHRVRQPIHLHTVNVNELTLPLIALSSQEVFKVFDLVRQLRAQIELRWKLRDPVSGEQEKWMKMEKDEEK